MFYNKSPVWLVFGFGFCVFTFCNQTGKISKCFWQKLKLKYAFDKIKYKSYNVLLLENSFGFY